jgi:hypothetical protein
VHSRVIFLPPKVARADYSDLFLLNSALRVALFATKEQHFCKASNGGLEANKKRKHGLG